MLIKERFKDRKEENVTKTPYKINGISKLFLKQLTGKYTLMCSFNS